MKQIDFKNFKTHYDHQKRQINILKIDFFFVLKASIKILKQQIVFK